MDIECCKIADFGVFCLMRPFTSFTWLDAFDPDVYEKMVTFHKLKFDKILNEMCKMCYFHEDNYNTVFVTVQQSFASYHKNKFMLSTNINLHNDKSEYKKETGSCHFTLHIFKVLISHFCQK